MEPSYWSDHLPHWKAGTQFCVLCLVGCREVYVCVLGAGYHEQGTQWVLAL